MPLLNCMVTHCVYNKDELCSRGDIRIGGREARVADETCCDSFRDRAEGTAVNSVTGGCGCSSIHVDCEAEGCTYNENCKCTANEVNIDGACADRCEDTVCETFRCKNCG